MLAKVLVRARCRPRGSLGYGGEEEEEEKSGRRLTARDELRVRSDKVKDGGGSWKEGRCARVGTEYY